MHALSNSFLVLKCIINELHYIFIMWIYACSVREIIVNLKNIILIIC